jgi:hypothetical protein
MNRNSTLIGLFCLVANFLSGPLSATVYVDNGTATPYTLNTGDSLHIASGTYTGAIISFATGAKISVAQSATFQPASMAFPNVRGTIYVYGTFIMNSQLRSNTGFQVHNYGVIWIKSTTLMSGSGQLWTNYFGALMNMDGDVSMTNDNAILNQGTINAGANFTMTGSTSFTNRLFVNIAGDFLNSGGTVTNQGRWYTTGSMTFNNGLAIINNYCRMIAEKGIYNTSGQLTNYGFLWSKSSPGTGVLQNSGTITNGPGAVILAVNLNNTGVIRGAGYMHFTGTTSTTNSGTTGVNVPTTDTIKMYDASRANMLTIYDVQTGTVHPNVIFSQFMGLDSNRAYIGGCSMEMVSQIPLAVNWNFFTVTLEDKTPVLNWAAKADQGTRYEVQRSYDGKNFSTIYLVKIEEPKATYNYADLGANSRFTTIYYRIMAVEPTGAQRFSDTRTIKFGNSQTVSVQTMPNPFTSNFTINYQSNVSGQVTIKMISMTGQQQFSKTIAVIKGTNAVTISDVSSLPKGVYMVQVIGGNQLLSAEKIIKQ